ncbi:MAG: hypothetical protein WDO56_09785 [Gammaproteobacteria bacterium]
MSKQHPGLIKRTGVDGRHIWHIDKHVRGYGRLCESTETDDEDLAGQILAKRLVDIRNAKLFGIRPPRTFKQAADKYLKTFPEEAKENRAITALKDLSEFIDHKFIHTINDDTFAPYITARRKEVRAPVQAGHDSGVMADTFPAAWRTVFRCEAGRFAVAPGLLSAVPGTVSGMAPE